MSNPGSVVPPTTISDETVRAVRDAVINATHGIDPGGRAARLIAESVVAAELPYIEAGLRAKIAAEIETHGARRKGDNRLCGLMPVDFAARVARGTQEATK